MKWFPCVVIIGPRQVGKTTLVRDMIQSTKGVFMYLDLELDSDLDKLSDPETFLRRHADKTIIMDEVQRSPKLFPLLRALIDLDNRPGRFILLGSASPALIQDSSESLAGRIAFVEVHPFDVMETDRRIKLNQVWLKGGFPAPLLGKSPWQNWMANYTRTYIESDLPQLGFPANRNVSRKIWAMLAHYHGNLVNYSELAKSLEISVNTAKSYVQFLENALLIRTLPSWHENSGKRLVKAPKVYLRDSGILHYFLDIADDEALQLHPKLGSSWEGFVIEQIAAQLEDEFRFYFYRTHDGAEMDLVLEKRGKKVAAIEIKMGSKVSLSKGNMIAFKDLNCKHQFVITLKSETYSLSNGAVVCDLKTFLKHYLPKI
jgi:predicted AAA+ superfamily ATPase